MCISSIGIDLGKTTFHLIALDDHGKIVIRKKFSRKQLLAYTANLQPALVGIEACSGAHFVGAALRRQGHDVRLIPAQFVKPFVKSNKNDFIDAEAIAEAVTRQNMKASFSTATAVHASYPQPPKKASPRVAIRGYTRL
jgi:transposase